ncbi:MAG: hypothetical protein KIS85_09055 [Anaerolineales bacterium]|nr:hypothetical protein [Anaerolineales bacterium]
MVNRGLLQQFQWAGGLPRNLVWGLLTGAALVAFELFNFSTTEFAMRDLLGDLRFGGMAWATILALAFCAMDFAGIAHLFGNSSDLRNKQALEIWYLFGAWLLAATMNALLTWWGISVAIVSHASLGSAVLGREAVLQTVPAFVAVLVWLIRMLVIGAFITTGGKLFTRTAEKNNPPTLRRVAPAARQGQGQQSQPQPAMYHGLVPQGRDENDF